ncbi:MULTISPECIES: FtsX-like permease family protein [Bacillus]|uniref:ABC transporter permease n=3 Tax=Bacillus cereus group TaxID=86661 RepID=A0A2A7D9W4_BACAN|nr:MULTISPECIES: ABC transporter permease [Bacillus]MCP1163762.1 ABC transporter permease [Bacillus sp. 1813sda1]MDC7975329.1 ABC transporter permease [Bacillus sp. BLCC-B18]OTW72584.1 ABC transporter [Bacillus thuringiensis serovar coreanensis]OTX49640.1 ABC transporter [Bacillus thuringiensis serovar sooncheon]OTX57183.1 ABC transporter [Bacillus thuringiensis serovar guiyangiensis]
MYSKIAIGNVKKSFKDYAIYFLTLTLAVCIFYSFNSIESQKALMEINASDRKYVPTVMNAISNVSVFVSVILGGLILYANNFLIKKRKKELGIYMTLGMGRRNISRILVTETFLVGVISLMSGLIIGIGVSQGLSTFALKLFDLPVNKYKFAISTGAIGKSVLYFGIMFLLVMLFNVYVVSKYKIIDLLTAGRKNEDVKFRNPLIYVITFIMCVASLGYAYVTVLKIGLNFTNPMLVVSIILGILGTLLFFFSLSGFILYVVKKNKKVYFKGLNIFIIKQINSKVNTNFISMSVICLMLFLTMVALSTGISFNRMMDATTKEITPFDASITLENKDESYTIEEVLNKANFKISNNEKYVSYNVYRTGMEVVDFVPEGKDYNNDIDFIKVSDYNKILNLKGEKEITLNNNEILLLSNESRLANSTNERLKNSNKVNIKEKEYLVKNAKVIQENLFTYDVRNNYFTIVINDEFLSGYKITESVLNVNYLDGNREEYNKKYDNVARGFYDENGPKLNINRIAGKSKDEVCAGSKGLKTIVLFIGIYIGIVFLITSMAVLALQQLSEASDSIERYKSLKRIGSNGTMIDKTIFIQTFVYFSLPVFLSIIHSIVGIYVVNYYINTFQQTDIILPALMTGLVFLVVYVVYFYTTYVGYKNIVKSNT